MEIYRFLPPALLEEFDPEAIENFETFLGYVAKARYIQELEEDLLARAIAKVFSQ